MTNETKNTVAAVMPFAVWIALMMILPPTAGAYAVRTAATAAVGGVGLFFWQQTRRTFRPRETGESSDRCLPRALFKTLFSGLIGGGLVAAVWIFPESFAWYRTWLCLPIGALPEPAASSPYDPAVCGWTLTLLKLVGSAFIIAPVEEIFFRFFLYRRLQSQNWLNVPLSRFDLSAFLWMIFLFTLEHDRPAAAAFAGTVYGLLAIRCGLPAAILAHVVTNLALALHVIHYGQWGFW